MRDVRRLVILDWLLERHRGERWTTHADHLSEVDRAQARAILESQRTGLREAPAPCGAGMLRRRGAVAPERWPRTPRMTGCWSAWTPASHPACAGRRRPGRRLRQPGRPGVQRHLPWPSAVRAAGDVEVTVRDLAAVYGARRAGGGRPGRAGPAGGDMSAVRRVANALQVGMAGETHFLFGDDRFGPGAAEFERAAARDGTAAAGPGHALGQIRGWIDAIQPRARPARRGRRPDHAGLGRAAAAGLVPAR